MKKIGYTKNWTKGDEREIPEKELKTLNEKGLYDSYDKTYIINGFKWKIVSKVVNSDSKVTYTLECMGTEED